MASSEADLPTKEVNTPDQMINKVKLQYSSKVSRCRSGSPWLGRFVKSHAAGRSLPHANWEARPALASGRPCAGSA